MVLKDLERYEHAALANQIYGDKSRGSFALPAMQNLYKKFGVDSDDPIMNRAFAEASVGLSEGHMTSAGVFQAMQLYTNKFMKALSTTKVGEYLSYVKTKLPKAIQDIADKYTDKTLEEVGVKAKAKDKESAILYEALTGALLTSKLEGELYAETVKTHVKDSLKDLESKLATP